MPLSGLRTFGGFVVGGHRVAGPTRDCCFRDECEPLRRRDYAVPGKGRSGRRDFNLLERLPPRDETGLADTLAIIASYLGTDERTIDRSGRSAMTPEQGAR